MSEKVETKKDVETVNYEQRAEVLAKEVEALKSQLEGLVARYRKLSSLFNVVIEKYITEE